MKPANSSYLLIIALVLALVSCSKERVSDATEKLESSFQVATPEVQKAIESVNASLKQRNYAEATRTLAPVIQHPLTDAQRQAIGLTLQQINQEVGRNPALDTKEMYDLRAKMFQAVHGGPRF